GFDLKWNMGWMHDTLEYMRKDTIDRQKAHDKLSFGMLYQYSECFTQVFSHDEVVHEKKSILEKMPGESLLNKARQMRCLYGFMWMWPGKKTLFMGCDFGQTSEWRYEDFLDWHLLDSLEHSGIQSCVRDLNQIYLEIPSIAKMDYNKDGFEWINHSDSNNCALSFLRKGHKAEDTLLVIGNFSSEALDNYRVAVPLSGRWEEIFNSDSKKYGGLQSSKSGSLIADMHYCDGRDYSILLSLLPHSITIFRWQNRAKNSYN
ncbi:MAG: alpha amylase C-terminal domain-containing protein, partial [Verrucomicrobiota bacterium]|nr:alpha amylase C-terminal domain-containing protein [Verrucomicrobiota bacterium]